MAPVGGGGGRERTHALGTRAGLDVVVAQHVGRDDLAALGVDPAKVPVVTRDQVKYAKPDPDLFLTAAQRLGVDIRESLVLGDSVWDMIAAQRARALGVGLLSGGYGEDELTRAGAFRVYRDADELRSSLDELGVLP